MKRNGTPLSWKSETDVGNILEQSRESGKRKEPAESGIDALEVEKSGWTMFTRKNQSQGKRMRRKTVSCENQCRGNSYGH